MEPRQFKHLNNLNDDEFFKSVSIGMKMCLNNAKQFQATYEYLVSGQHYRMSAIVQDYAKEEAAKYLILLDAARCPIDNTHKKRRGDLLRGLASHIVRLLYAASCSWRPSQYTDLVQYIESERGKYYADGPEIACWKFYNDLLRRREEKIYIDYVKMEEGIFQWSESPNNYNHGSSSDFIQEPDVLKLAKCLSSMSFDDKQSLKTIATYWRDYDVECNEHWSEYRNRNIRTIELVADCGVDVKLETVDLGYMIDQWLYPMYMLDLNILDNSDEVDEEIMRGRNDAFGW